MSSRYRRRVGYISRTTPFEPGVRPTLQIKQQMIDAEKEREKSFQKRLKLQKERLEERKAALQEIIDNLKKTTITQEDFERKKSKQEIVNEGKIKRKEIKESLKNTTTRVTKEGETVKVRKVDTDLLDKLVEYDHPLYLVDDDKRGTWVEITDNRDTGAGKKWKLQEIKDGMLSIEKTTSEIIKAPSDVAENTAGADAENLIYKDALRSTFLMTDVELAYDKETGRLWGRYPDRVATSKEKTEKQRLLDMINGQGGY